MSKAIASLFLPFLLASSSLGQPVIVPNWTVPPYTSAGGMTTMTDATPPRLFIGVQPCRLVDTRPGSGFAAGFGAPALSPGVPRSFDLDSGPCPGLPAGIDAYSLNVTVVNPAGAGLVIYPQGGSQPVVSSINYSAAQTIANAVIVPAGTGGSVTVVAGVSGTNVLIDINGYFSDTLGNGENWLQLTTNSTNVAAFFRNTNTSCEAGCGVLAIVDSAVVGEGDASWAIEGATSSNLGVHYGVRGIVADTNDDSAGVLGQDGSGTAMRLITNGTYNADGTVNMDTARRLGWDRIWAQPERPAPRAPSE